MVVASSQRRRSLARRRLFFVAGVGIVIGIAIFALLVAGGRPAAEVRAERFVAAWARGDYPAMHAELTADARKATPLEAFAADYRAAAATATATTFAAGKTGKLDDGVVSVPMTVSTRIFGTIRAAVRVHFAGEDDDARVDWAENLTFPGVNRGERLARRTTLPARASILARDGTPLAEGTDRTSPLGPVAAAIAGQLGPVPAARVDEA